MVTVYEIIKSHHHIDETRYVDMVLSLFFSIVAKSISKKGNDPLKHLDLI